MKISVLKQNGITENWTNTTVMEPNTLADLATLITTHWYSGSIFKDNYANNENFLSTEFIVLDYDNKPKDVKLTLEEATKLFAPYKHIIATTRSHQKPKGEAPAADRFRVVLFLTTPITDTETFTATWHHVANLFPGCDKAAKDPARRLFNSVDLVTYHDGETIAPVAAEHKPERAPIVPGKRGKLSKQTKNFMAEGTDGDWNPALFKAAKDHQENGYTEEEFIKRAETITGHLDAIDLRTIQSAYSKDPKYDARPPVDVSKAHHWTLNWMQEKRAALSYRTGAMSLEGKEEPGEIIFKQLVNAANAWCENNPLVDGNGNFKPRPKFPRECLQDAFDVWVHEERKLAVKRLAEHVKHDRASDRHTINRWILAVTGKEDPKDIAVLTHFIWQVKRKLNGLKVDWHMMPIVYGPTGSGKTEAITKLLLPIQDVTMSPQDMTMLGDSREGFRFGKFYVAFFDELARADKVDVGALKQKITGDYISYRQLGTNNDSTVRNVCTFIGATNNPVESIIYDPTSARRFWQIDSLEHIDWESINSIDYLSMWRSVSEEEVTPVFGLLDDIRQVQETELRAKSLVEQWLFTHTEPDEACAIKSTTAYEGFQEWCAWQQIRTVTTHHNFGVELKRLGVNKVRRAGGSYYKFKLKVVNIA